MLAGPAGNGTAFSVNTDGNEFNTAHIASLAVMLMTLLPMALLVLSNGALYGTASGSIFGNVFKVNTDGSGLKALYVFNGGNDGGNPPFGGVILSGNTLYGTTWSPATVFKVNTDGTGFTTLRCLSCGPETNSATLGHLQRSGFGRGFTVWDD